MRFIDADSFKKQVVAAAISNGFMQSSEKVRAMIELIDMQPTAFDIDNVVEKLEELAEDEKKIDRNMMKNNHLVVTVHTAGQSRF